MSDQTEIQDNAIFEEKLRAVFRGVLERFIDDVINGKVEMDAVLATWLRDQRRLQNLVGDWIDKARNDQTQPHIHSNPPMPLRPSVLRQDATPRLDEHLTASGIFPP